MTSKSHMTELMCSNSWQILSTVATTALESSTETNDEYLASVFIINYQLRLFV